MTTTADPLAGSYVVEALTDGLEQRAWALIEQIDAMGGAVAAIEAGWMQGEIADASYAYQRRVEEGEQIVVGVNRFAAEAGAEIPIFSPDASVALEQATALARIRSDRDGPAVSTALDALKQAARGSENVLYPMREALKRMATVGEVCGALREVWGEYRPEVRL